MISLPLAQDPPHAEGLTATTDAAARHGEVILRTCAFRSKMLLGEGRLQIASWRLGRAHPPLHAPDRRGRTRAGVMCRLDQAIAFGKPSPTTTSPSERIAAVAASRSTSALLVSRRLHDGHGGQQGAQAGIPSKVAVPNITLPWSSAPCSSRRGGVTRSSVASMWAHSRTLRFADGDEVHGGNRAPGARNTLIAASSAQGEGRVRVSGRTIANLPQQRCPHGEKSLPSPRPGTRRSFDSARRVYLGGYTRNHFSA